MILTEALQREIDALSYVELLRRWRFAPTGDQMFQGESGDYFARRMAQLRAEPGGQDKHTSASKAIGW